jgi:hypothetical protein
MAIQINALSPAGYDVSVPLDASENQILHLRLALLRAASGWIKLP